MVCAVWPTMATFKAPFTSSTLRTASASTSDRSARGDGGLMHDAGGLAGRLGRAGMRAEDDAVSGLEADQRLEDRGRGRVGGRHDSTDQPDGFRDGQRAVFLILLQDAAGQF